MPCRLFANTREFLLSDEEATAASDAILDAVRRGGDFVHLEPLLGPEADVLITPSTTVVLQRVSPIQPSSFDQGDLAAFPAFDWPDAY